MEKLVKVTSQNYPYMCEENKEKYILVNEEDKILGSATIDERALVNKLQINIDEKYTSNGYGKKAFEMLLEEYERQYGKTTLRFEISDESRFNSILHKFGGINVSKHDGYSVYILTMN